MARLYADEDFPFPVIEGFAARPRCPYHVGGRARESAYSGCRSLAFATGLGRAILNRKRLHFITLHRQADVDLRIPVTAAQKQLIMAAVSLNGSDMAAWARPILLQAAQDQVARTSQGKGRQK